MSDAPQDRHRDVAACAAPTPAKACRFGGWRRPRYPYASRGAAHAATTAGPSKTTRDWAWRSRLTPLLQGMRRRRRDGGCAFAVRRLALAKAEEDPEGGLHGCRPFFIGTGMSRMKNPCVGID